MKIELEFLDRDNDKVRVHNEELIYEGFVPIPAVGEYAWVDGEQWKVFEREFIYTGHYAAQPGVPNVKVTLWCKKP